MRAQLRGWSAALRDKADEQEGISQQLSKMFASAFEGEADGVRLSILVVVVAITLAGIIVSLAWYLFAIDDCFEKVVRALKQTVAKALSKQPAQRGYVHLRDQPRQESERREWNVKRRSSPSPIKKDTTVVVEANVPDAEPEEGVPLSSALKEELSLPGFKEEAQIVLTFDAALTEEQQIEWTASSGRSRQASTPVRHHHQVIAANTSPPGLALPIPGGSDISVPDLPPVVTSRGSQSPPRSLHRGEPHSSGMPNGVALPVHPLLHLPIKPPPLDIPAKRRRSHTPKKIDVNDLPTNGEQALSALRNKLRSISMETPIETPRAPPSYRAPPSARAKNLFLEDAYRGLTSNPASVTRPIDTQRSSSTYTTPAHTQRSARAGEAGVALLFGGFFSQGLDSQRSPPGDQPSTPPSGPSEYNA